ncbi:MAG: extracellular solute-binding protein [Roseiflexaceae bacterium]
MTNHRDLTRREFLRIAAATAGSAVLASCGSAPAQTPAASEPTAAPAAPAAAPAAENVSLRFTCWDSATGADVYNSIIDKFKAANPGVQVSTEFTPDGYDDKILTGLATGSAPDVFLWWNHPKLVAAGGAEDLMPYVQAEKLDLSIYYPSVLEMNKYGDILVGTPDAFTPRAIFYNKKVFDAAKVPYPTNDWTWNDLVQIAKSLTKGSGKDAQYGFFIYNQSYPLQGYVWSNGGDFISPDGKKATGFIDSPETIAAVQWWADLVLKEKVAPTAQAVTLIGDQAAMFKSGKLAMMDNGRWPQSEFMKTPGLELGTVMIPKSPTTGKRVPVLHEASFCIAKNGKNKQQAWQLAKWLGSEEGNTAFAKAGWGIPATKATGAALGMERDPIEKTWFDSIPLATVKSDFMRTTVWDKIDSTLLGPALEAITTGKATAADKLKEIAPEVDKLLASG